MIRENKMNRNLILLKVIILIFFILIFTFKYVFSKESIPIHSVERDDKKISLTFDVNWAENDYLYEILDVLEENHVKATFFVMGKWVIYPEGNREKLLEISKRGHEIGNHSYVHPDFKNISRERIVEEVKKTENIIKDEIGVKTNFFRFPSGSYNEESLNILNDMGYKCIQWDVDSVDWKGINKEQEYKRVFNNVKGGSIVLYHNNGKFTVDNLSELIPALKKIGYEFVKISDIIYENSYEIDYNGKQMLINQKQKSS
ncbi:polysaccharide deacetylase family protein [Clostridium sp.]|uniref:polysaccharide deacetylase family protein n=1 Tax=Clostridium sp. TaxID=1506 RepID=UPI0026077986|nr:polysaccharide deacetylase family protein [Clostridium sp.]